MKLSKGKLILAGFINIALCIPQLVIIHKQEAPDPINVSLLTTYTTTALVLLWLSFAIKTED